MPYETDGPEGVMLHDAPHATEIAAVTGWPETRWRDSSELRERGMSRCLLWP